MASSALGGVNWGKICRRKKRRLSASFEGVCPDGKKWKKKDTKAIASGGAYSHQDQQEQKKSRHRRKAKKVGREGGGRGNRGLKVLRADA